jgi:hypothetical protein
MEAHMNKVRFLFGAMVLAVAGVVGVVVQAQTGQGDPATGKTMPMMGMGMGAGMGMMSGQMHQVVMMPFLLPELHSELGLSTQQVTQLRELKQDMLTKGKDLSTQIAAKQKELNALLTGTSKGEEVKKLFEQIANLRAGQLYAGYETTTKMKAALTEAQRTKLAALKPHEAHQAMMSRMTMNDMMQMMQITGGEGMMIGQMMMSGMMGQAMMGHGMMMQGGPLK